MTDAIESKGETAVALLATTTRRGRAMIGPLDLRVAPGATVILEGPTGSGKSTTLDLIAGLERPASGQVLLNGRVAAAPDRMIAPHERGIAYLVQGIGLWDECSAVENVRRCLDGPAERGAAETLLDLVHFRADRRMPVERLSGGERMQVGIARVLARGRKIMLFDEPGAHVDRDVRRELLAAIRERARLLGATVIAAVHAAADAEGLAADGTFRLIDGRLRAGAE